MNSTAQNATEYGGFWRRFIAFIIDSIAISVIGYLIWGEEVSQFVMTDGRVAFDVEFDGVKSFVPVIYNYVLWSFLSTSPGKMIMGLKLVDEKGNKVGFLRPLARIFGYFISFVPFALGFIWIAFDAKKQGWHDKISGTYVVRS